MQDKSIERAKELSTNKFMEENAPYVGRVKGSDFTKSLTASRYGGSKLQYQLNQEGLLILQDKIDEYKHLADTSNAPLTKTGLCTYLGILTSVYDDYINYTTGTLENEVEDYFATERANVLKFAEQMIQSDIMNSSLSHEYNASIAKVVLSKDHDYREVVTTDNHNTQSVTIINDLED